MGNAPAQTRTHRFPPRDVDESVKQDREDCTRDGSLRNRDSVMKYQYSTKQLKVFHICHMSAKPRGFRVRLACLTLRHALLCSSFGPIAVALHYCD